MRDFSRRTEKIAICRGEWEISRSVAENVKNRDLSRRIGNFAVSYMPRNPFVPVLDPYPQTSAEPYPLPRTSTFFQNEILVDDKR